MQIYLRLQSFNTVDFCHKWYLISSVDFISLRKKLLVKIMNTKGQQSISGQFDHQFKTWSETESN